MQWLIDGYNVIRRMPELAARERESLQLGREALCRMLSTAVRRSGDRFTVVFDGDRGGASAPGGLGVRVTFSMARETADSVLARLAGPGKAVVSNDREVRKAASGAGAIAITTDEFIARLRTSARPTLSTRDETEDQRPRPKKGNPRRLSKKARAVRRALGHLGGPSGTSR
jgi:predicted RNA-binding protein with PIN domain